MARRRSKKRRFRRLVPTLILLLVVAVSIQFIPARRDNPPPDGSLRAPERAAVILQRSCYDCHSHDTRWPWYSAVAPLSWLLADEVRRGRRAVNFSVWDQYDPLTRDDLRRESIEEIRAQRMPPATYLWLHPGAAVSRGDLADLENSPPW